MIERFRSSSGAEQPEESAALPGVPLPGALPETLSGTLPYPLPCPLPSIAPLAATTPPQPRRSAEEQAKAIGLEMRTSLHDECLQYPTQKLLPYSFVKRHLVVVYAEKDNKLLCATPDPLLLEPIEEALVLSKQPLQLVHASREAILEAIDLLYQHQTDSARDLFSEREGEEVAIGLDDEADVVDLLDDRPELAPAVRLTNYVVAEAIRRSASDIHVEPNEAGLIIRFRVDGVLHDFMQPPEDLKMALITRLKVMAKMDIAERRLPQDGRLKMRLGAKKYDFRMSTLPVANGERVVLRILDKGKVVLGIDKLGMPDQLSGEFRRLINFSEGIVLVTGPTGSGKTTTLYSALTELASRDVNIMTVEDPVEYRLKGISQMGVHPKIGLTFAAGLRHILRQDPDIIMIGEIRDKETAEIAIQSALTGHLVLSTLHTNDAPSAITRLVDMGVEPYLIASCCVGVLAQRLVRTLCAACHHTNPHCPQCQGSGFYGRCGIYELMTMTSSLKRQIMISPEAGPIQAIALQEGMQRLKEYGLQLVQQGITTEEEVWRVTRGDES